jgi:hypothetical protein
MEQTSNITLRKYADLFYRKKYLLAWLLLLSLPIGLTAYLLGEPEVSQAARAWLSRQDVSNIMRRDIAIQPTNTGNDAGSIEEAARIATNTESQALAAKAAMDQKDQAMRDHKRAHSDEMPGQRSANAERMAALQEQYRKNQDAILAAQETKALWQEQADALRQASSSAESAPPSPQGEPPAVHIDPLTRARNQLKELRRKYTENHPEVKRLVARIKKMEAKPPEASANAAAEGPAPAARPVKGEDAAPERAAMRYEAQIRSYDMQIAAMTKESEDIVSQIKQLQKEMDAASIHEAEWSSLTRDYAGLKQQYDKLAEKNLEAQSALNQARRQQPGQSRIGDSARFPETSFKPGFGKIMGASILLAAVLGAGLVMLSAVFDQSFRTPADLENYLRLPVASVLSYIPTGREKKRAGILFLVKTLMILFAGILVLGYFVWAWSTGKIVI